MNVDTYWKRIQQAATYGGKLLTVALIAWLVTGYLAATGPIRADSSALALLLGFVVSWLVFQTSLAMFDSRGTAWLHAVLSFIPGFGVLVVIVIHARVFRFMKRNGVPYRLLSGFAVPSSPPANWQLHSA